MLSLFYFVKIINILYLICYFVLICFLGEVGMDDDQVNMKKRKVMTNNERQEVYAAFLKASVKGKFKKYSTKKVATEFAVPLRTVQRIWKRSKENLGNDFADVSHRRIKNCGRKQI